MFKRTGAIPKKYNYGQFMHGTPETINRSSADMEAIGHSRSKEDPGGIIQFYEQHQSAICLALAITYSSMHDKRIIQIFDLQLYEYHKVNMTLLTL